MAGQILYKYLDVQGAATMLHFGNLQFTNATRLNDPFDCHPSLIDFSKITPERACPWGRERTIQLESNRYENNREDAWVCCLSKANDSILMWSYYNGHKGVCIGLDMEKVKTYLRPDHGIMVHSSCYEVEYRDIIEKPDYFAGRENFFYYQMLTKAKEWSHEQEVRMFIMKPSPWIMGLTFEPKSNEIDYRDVRALPVIGDECFAAIYLGVKIDEDHKKKIIEYARKRNPDIKIYQMQVNPDAFKLDYVDID